jgi:ATP-dependent Clp protease ATP-binding subunit ClpC
VAENILPDANLITCDRCQGWGVIKDGRATATCPSCQGRGFELRLGEHRLIATLPESVPRGQIAKEKFRRQLQPWLKWIIVGLTAAVGAWILTQPTTNSATGIINELSTASRSTRGLSSFLGQLFSTQGWPQLIFWLLASADLYLLFLTTFNQKPPHSLRDLRDRPANRRLTDHVEADGAINIIPFFTDGARQSIDDALQMTERTGSDTLTSEIMLASLLCSGKTAIVVRRLEQDPAGTCQNIIKRIKPQRGKGGSLNIAPEVRQLILLAFNEAWANGYDYVDAEDLLLVLAKYDSPQKVLLEELGLTYEQIKSIAGWLNEEMAAIHQWQFWRERGRLRPKGYMNKAWTARPTPFLNQYSRDFTQLASLGQLPVVKVRQTQIESIIRILASGDRNNALVVGEPGVGKTSIVGAVAARMVEETVPEPLKDKRLIELDLAALVSGGGTEKENLDKVLQEVKSAGNIILFIGHIESLVSSGGGLTAATLLEAASKSAQLQIIGTATYADYHRYIESNQSFANSFQKVDVPEVSEEDAITIIEEESPRIQTQYQALLTYPAIVTAVKLSKRYIQDQVLPEKALAILADAAARVSGQKGRYVTQEVVEQVIAEKVHVPVQQLNQDERDKLQELDERLQERVIGQPEAVQKVAEALRRARTGLKDEKRPIGSFLFVGPTGVGKTETARSLAAIYYGDEKAMIRLDMSEYQDARAIYRLIGAPATSASEFTEGGALTKPVRERPYCLLLLDEIEKAHPDVLNLFLQLLDDGRLTENTGRTVSFASTIVIATSNAAAPEIVKMIEQGVSETDLNRQVTTLMQQSFKPEFLNRFDAVVPFRPLTPENVRQIASLMLGQVVKQLAEQGVDAEFAPDVVDYVSQIGFDQRFGARPLRRAIQDSVETKLADWLLTGKADKKQHLIIDLKMLGLTTTEVAPTAPKPKPAAPASPTK